MPDSLAPDQVQVQTADGFVVVSRRQRLKSGRPDGFQYSFDHYDKLDDAAEAHRDFERGEYEPWEAVALFAVADGLPLGGRNLITSPYARLAAERSVEALTQLAGEL